MIALIGEHAMLGVAVTVNEAEYETWFSGRGRILAGDAYTYCCWQVLAGIRHWIGKNNFQGDIAYFFEAGHASQTQANALMNRIFKDQRLKDSYRYASHAFVQKQKVRPVQTADILAWQQMTQSKKWLAQNPTMRKDFKALIAKPQHELFIASRKTVAGVIAWQRKLQGIPFEGVSGYWGPHWFWCPFDGDLGKLVL
jgi:hypothetical protein